MTIEINKPINEIIDQLYFKRIPEARMELFYRMVRVASLYLALSAKRFKGEF